MTRLRVARLAVLVLAVYASGCGRAPSDAPARKASLEASVRALPTASPAPPWSAAERGTLARTLSSIFADDITERETGIVVTSAEGATLFDRRGSVPVAPASTLKLVVAATALNRLGAKHRFATRFVSTEEPGADGALRGGLWLVGGGDPTLSSDDLRRGVGVLSRSGIKQIDGALAIDDTAFSGPEQNPRWDPDDLDYDYAAGTSAISLDEDTVEFDVTPDAGSGGAHVKPVPDNASIAFTGSVNTVPDGYSSFVSIERKTELPTFGASEAEAAETEPHNDYVLDGHIARGETQKFYKPVLGMPGYVGGVVASMLAARDIALTGGYHAGPAPAGATQLWEHESAPLADIEREMLVNSNNHTAETLLRIVGETAGHPGTDGAGIAVEKNELLRLGVPHERMTLYDGSGLAPSDRIMPVTLAKLLAAEARSANGDTFVRSLPRVGFEGTVRNHDLHAALGRTRAKSGHIEGVNGLAGIVQTQHHGRVAFAFIVNASNANADVVYEEMDRALDAIAGS
ncbi:MAG: D-alanyl-D-alanine carboxypeptidase/D-alanyl-D-alanine-endopeptidase [Candidatus Eremiobacteraeota bacterium]|nr:D-alanyl-D-alanine carboxypeptidase/D-alanyl-D-alanine-endopeptidase [Candidatus Eremiobacteraeota bacterium]